MTEAQSIQDDTVDVQVGRLVDLAVSMGAADARVIASSAIPVDDKLAKLCIDPGCDSYGLSPSCPPHVSGPSGLRRLKRVLVHAVAVRIIVPSSALFSNERRELGRFLYELVAGIEQEAVALGFTGSQAFAGGSCKQIFCSEHSECRRLSEKGQCRHPQHARSSMSGYGIDVSGLMKICGWPADINSSKAESTADPMSWIAGLIMIG